MKKIPAMILAIVLAIFANALTVDEAHANLKAARVAYTNALAEAGITNSSLRAEQKSKAAATRILPKSQRSFFENRRIAVSRDTETLPGYVITTWHRNGRPDTKAPAVVTNRLQKIVGKEQKNPIQELAEQWRETAAEYEADAQATKDIRKAAKRAEKNLSKVIKAIEQAKKKASDEDEAALYDLLIEILAPEDGKEDN